MAQVKDKGNVFDTLKKKYVLENNTFKTVASNNPKDKLEVEIGDSKQPDFKPQVKLMRWDNEVNFSARLIDDEITEPDITGEKDKIVWKNPKKEIRFYELPSSQDLPEGGYEFEITLKEKPNTNKITFSIQTKGLEFFYQPELTQEEKDKGYIRPENVVGSYAVYYKDCPLNVVGGKEYKSGKAFHIYRPRIEDAIGNWAWGELRINEEAGTLEVTIPQEFLDNAIYPVRHAAGATFGYTSIGGTGEAVSSDNIRGSSFSGSEGTASSISAYVSPGQGLNFKAAIYKDSDNQLLVGGSDVALSYTDWYVCPITSTTTLSEFYKVVMWFQGNEGIRYDSGGVGQGKADTGTYGSWDSSWGGSNNDNKYSIYVTYTAPISAPTATQFASSVTSMPVNLPSSISSGELLIALVETRNNATFTSGTPSGWTAFFSQQGGGSAGYLRGFYRIADGTEGASATWTASVTTTAIWQTLKISSWHGTTPPEVTTTSGDSSSANPPSLTPSWGADDTLWIAVAGHTAITDIAFTAGPSGYAGFLCSGASSGSTACSIATAFKQNNASSEDPGTFNASGSNRYWAAATIGIRPAGSGPTTYTATIQAKASIVWNTNGDIVLSNPGSAGNIAFGNITSTTTVSAKASIASAVTTYTKTVSSKSRIKSTGKSVTVSAKAKVNAKTQGLQDNFNDNNLDTTKWTDWGGANTNETGSALQITSTAAANYFGLTSVNSYALTGSYALSKLVSVGSSSIESLEIYPVQVVKDSSNNLNWLVTPFYGGVSAYKTVAGSSTEVWTDTYDPDVHKWFRIREASGTTYWETSVDGVTWTVRHSEANPIAVTAVVLEMVVGTWQTEASTADVIFDNFNIVVTTQSKTVSVKARIKSRDITKTVIAKARIESTGVTKTISTKARIKSSGNTVTVSSKSYVLEAGQYYFRGFENETSDAEPANLYKQGSNLSYTVKTNSTLDGNKLLQIDSTGTNHNFMLDTARIPAQGDYTVEALVYFDTYEQDRLGIAFRGNSAGNTCYFVAFRNGTTFRLGRLSGTTETVIDTQNITAISVDTAYHIKVQVNGSSIKARYWVDGASEPTSWTIDTTDSTYDNTHKQVGIYGYIGSGNVVFVDSLNVKALAAVTTQTQAVSAKARIKQASVTKTVQAKGRIKGTGVTVTIQAKARIKVAGTTKTVNAKSRIRKAVSSTVSALANIVAPTRVGTVILNSPEDTSAGIGSIYLAWHIPATLNGENLNFEVQVDKTDNTFNDLEVYYKSYVNSGFEYWNGSSWAELSSTGVSQDYVGNLARVSISLTSGSKYWRVRGVII